MDCNKDDAINAMQIAEKQLQGGDYMGARKMAQTAQRLFPQLENLTQLLTVCDIHCAALNRICGTDDDWYGILQIEQSADETTIRKQYRKLALLLHPDKNKFPGAESAFKLVGEANRLLTDEAKRKLYDLKYKVNISHIVPPKSFSNQPNVYTAVKLDPRTINGYSNIPYSQFSGRSFYNSQHQHAFLTCCPFCGMKYQSLKCHLNKTLRCQSCGRSFISRDSNDQTVPPAPTSQQSHVFQKKVASNSGISKPAAPKASRENRKRRRKQVVRSDSESEDFEEDEGDLLPKNDPDLTKDNSCRRSSRHKNPVSYKKYLIDDDDDLGNPSNKPSSSTHSMNENDKMEEVTGDVEFSDGHDSGDNHKSDRCEVPASITDALRNRKHKHEEFKVTRNGSNMPDVNDKKTEVEDIDADEENATEGQFLTCADPEFSDFEKLKGEDCFFVNQIWAVYDTYDSMPRFYARIKKVFSPPFKLEITWFEPKPDDEDGINWRSASLPISCGKYSLEKNLVTSDFGMFSHVVHGLKQVSRRAFFMYPKKGETWALFKNWDIRWSSDPDKCIPFEYEYVEIVSDYVEDIGIFVTYLNKVKGFVCLFIRTDDPLLNSFQIPPNELYRFSHQIPSFRMTGEEREGVPTGSFELDPAALPTNFNDLDDHNDIKMETCDDFASERNGSSGDHKPLKDEVEVVGSEYIHVDEG